MARLFGKNNTYTRIIKTAIDPNGDPFSMPCLRNKYLCWGLTV